ncbi:hypothetical protein GVAMD_1148 [Gardnerella vaginalis AMD]|nr:hypothetical protein GVAMD_1148 [Gardnerella vaginalis AMD]
MTHAFAANATAGNFYAASFAHDSLKAHALILAACALPIASWTEDLLTEQTVLLWL